MTTVRVAFEHLLQHEQFVRQTLSGLLRDPADLDDAVQETWLRMWRRPRARPAEPGAWFARTARNLAISRWRGERRRAARERLVADAAATECESAETSQRRVEMCQRVVAAILALDEPYRGVVLLRYEQGLDCAAIGKQLGRTAATVRSQLSRAHEQLRARLDREFGGRERWAGLALSIVGAQAATRVGGMGVVLAAVAGVAVIAAWFGWRAYEPALDPAAVHTVVAVPVADVPPPATLPSAVAAREPAELAQEPKPSLPFDLRQPAELFDRGYYEDYELATFSFEHGVRDDPDLSITNNDWEIELDGGEFRVNMVVDDRSVIVDLGAMEPAAFGAAALPKLQPLASVPVIEGHAYFVGTRDDDTTLATVLFVRDPQRNRTCRFDWFTTDGTGRAQGSLADPGKGKRWVDVLAGLFQEQLAAQSVHALKQPSVRLQLRGGAGGGNPRHIDLAGETNGRVDERSQQPIDVVTPATINEPCVGWSDGGSIPIGSTFAITRIDYSGGNRGDGNGPGGFRVVVNDKAIVDIEPSDPAIRGTWTRRLVVPNGAEGRTYFEILNSSWGEVQITGEFVAGAGLPGFGGRNAGFGRAPARAAPPAPVLGVPEVHLQMRSGAVGNPCTIDMRVRRTLRINRIAKSPLDFTTPLAANEWCVAFGKGGLLPPGCTFVVTKVRYHGETGDGGGSPLRIVIAGQRIVEIATAKQAITDEWNGSLEIPAGEETRTYVEVGNGSYVDVVITGRFEFR